MNTKNQNTNIYDELKNCVERAGLTIKDEALDGSVKYFKTRIDFNNEFYIIIMLAHVPDESLIGLWSSLSHITPEEKRPAVARLASLINQHLKLELFGLLPCDGTVFLCDEFPYSDAKLDLEQFLLFFKKNILYAVEYFQVIIQLVYSDWKPKKLFAKFLKHQLKSVKLNTIRTFPARKNQTRPSRLKAKDLLPFETHASAREVVVQYPTHTHGLHEIGMPELFIDPHAYGPKGNNGLICSAYEYFAKQENKSKLDAILAGQAIELTVKDLGGKPECHDVYCFRLVSPDFEGVKLAYAFAGKNIDPDIKFIQIWVKGDDFALNDEYYRGGIIC